MPVYEYHCRACGSRFSRFFKSAGSATTMATCTNCGEADAPRVLSSFQVHHSLKSQIERIDPMHEKEIDAAMRPHIATDPLNRINLDVS
jgi:putative FmdB family regulatory protein